MKAIKEICGDDGRSNIFVRERNNCWIAFAQIAFGLPERILCDHIAHGHGDDTLLVKVVILIFALIFAAHKSLAQNPEGGKCCHRFRNLTY